MENVAIHVILPKGLRLKNGMTLYKDTTLTFVSAISPFYCSVAQVRLMGGPALEKLPDLSIACMIYESSKDADSHTYRTPPVPDEGDTSSPKYLKYKLFTNARQNWVVATAAKDLLSNIWDLSGARGAKTLANFSVEKLPTTVKEGIPQKIAELKEEADKWRIVMNSGADVGFGGHVKGDVAAKGMYDMGDTVPGRTWIMTGGMGANRKTVPGWGSNAKPVKYASPPVSAWRIGRWYGSYMASFNPAIRY